MHYSKPFTKLFSSIITSSIWNENDKVRVVWITMLALSDASGFVCASVGGLAHAARVEKSECEAALGCLLAPDDDSRSKEFDGQRVEMIDGGYLILNYKKYRDLGRKIDRDEYLADKQWESRQKKKKRQQTSTLEDKASTNASASASASVSFWEELKRNPLYKGVEIDRELEKAKQWCRRKGRRLTQRFFENWLSKADRVLVDIPKPKPNYLPPIREMTEEELAAQRKIVREASDKLKAEMNR